MTTCDTELVWYASYGSNCSRARFLTYLRGGRPPGSDRDQLGARDATDPLGDAPVVFSTAVCFAGYSKRWGGAPAFLEHERTDRPGALGRRYLITRQQFADVLAQESGRAFDSAELPAFDSFGPGERVAIGGGFYDALVGLEPVEGVPCVSFTAPTPPEDRVPAPPSEAYLATIVRGLAECHELDPEEIADRLCAARGVAPTWTVASVSALMRSE